MVLVLLQATLKQSNTSTTCLADDGKRDMSLEERISSILAKGISFYSQSFALVLLGIISRK